jgi:hypothetical protein
MVVGSSGVREKAVESFRIQQTKLGTQFTSEIAPLRAENQRYSDWLSGIRPILLKDRLKGRRVALVQTGDYSSLAPSIRDALDNAGATVTSLTILSPTFAQRADRDLTAILSKLRDAHPSLELERSAIVRVVATALAKPNGDADMEVLAGARLLERDGSYTDSVQYVVLLGGARDDSAPQRVEALDRELITDLKKLGVTVIEVEPFDAVRSYVPLLQGLDVTTVDNADTDIGTIATILALDSPVSDYGAKPSARGGLVPRPTEQ